MKQIRGWAYPDADQFMAAEMKADGTYQASHLQAALRHVRDWTLAVDGGAHVGTWTRLLSAVFSRVISVEPSPDTYEALEANVRRFELANVETKPVALGSARGRVSMSIDGRAAALANTGARYTVEGGTIRCETIDEWNLPSLGFLKLDVEGSEVAALQGAALTLARCRPVVLFENKYFWRRYGLVKDAPQQFLLTLGYRHLAKAGCDEIWGSVQ